jgi:SAM-dependent methyltransferase
MQRLVLLEKNLDKALFVEMDRLETIHWWFLGKRAIVMALVDYLMDGRKDAEIADFGAGIGHMLSPLSAYGNVVGMEMSEDAKNMALSRWGKVYSGWLPDSVPFSDESFDLIILSDVLEHIKDDVRSLGKVMQCLKRGGFVILTVPAFMFLYCGRDRLHGHHRRYSLKELKEKIKVAGMEVKYISYFNFYLFPLALVERIARRIFPSKLVSCQP